MDAKTTMEQQKLIEKIKTLPQDKVAEVEDFVDWRGAIKVSIKQVSIRRLLITRFNTRARTPTSILFLKQPR